MLNNSDPKKMPRRSDVPPRVPKGNPSLAAQFVIAFVVFLLLSTGYSSIKKFFLTSIDTVPLSQIANDVGAGKIAAIAAG